jgi:hypothetical protein
VNLTRQEAMMFVYNFGVVVSGASLARGIQGAIEPALLALGALAALIWTVYFRVALLERFRGHPILSDPDEGHPDPDPDPEVDRRG